MNQEKTKKKLFKEFPPVTTEEWEKVIERDLKGAGYERKLVWKTIDGFRAKPYYRKGDLKSLPYVSILPGEFPFVRSNKKNANDWFVRQDIFVGDVKEANKKALEILMKGVTSLGFVFDEKFEPSVKLIEDLTENIFADAVELNFEFQKNAHKVVGVVDELAKKYNRDLDKIYGSVDIDPLGELVQNGEFLYPPNSVFDLIKVMIEEAKHLPHFKVLTVNGKYFHNSGSSIVEELAFSLAQGANYLTQLTERGLSVDKIAPRIKFQFATGSNYFMEIAKLRAARWLWAHIVKAYGPSGNSIAAMNIHCTTSDWNKTIYDPFVNMLRTTTESMSSILGGTDSLTVKAYNSVFEKEDAFSERIARNQQLVLKEESYLDKVIDPAAGSYYIENLTNLIAEEVWKRFIEVQEKGGFTEAVLSGFIQEKVNETAKARDMAIAMKKEILLGTNQYANPTEFIDKEMGEQLFDNGKPSSSKGLKPYRGAMAFESLRYQTDKFAKVKPRPKVFMMTMGHPAMRKARAQFAANFFGCAGYEIINNNGFGSVEDAIKAFEKAKADIAVICSSDEEYKQLAPEFQKRLNNKAILVIAGFPKEIIEDLKAQGIKHFIHVKSNVLETLKKFQGILGLKNKLKT
ncbi:MAG: methylmalonyl-CoA mutase small subunit [Chlorobi bacterium]|nr:methylmalonyl-CoA mutase small subunit [Chlorobiota bacterium]